MIKTNFLSDEIPREGVHYACVTCITIDSVVGIKKKEKELSISSFRRTQIQNKEDKDF